MRLISEKSIEWGLPLYVVKHDIQSAFDFVNHKYLLKALLQAGVDCFTARLILKLAARVKLIISSSTWTLE
eukprot:12839966-Heterocapsa_arctica.AAC.1